MEMVLEYHQPTADKFRPRKLASLILLVSGLAIASAVLCYSKMRPGFNPSAIAMLFFGDALALGGCFWYLRIRREAQCVKHSRLSS
jgi:hypothetical protein